MLTGSITISDKGQIAIPKELGSKVIKLEILSNNEVRMIPVKDVGGSLTDFAKKIYQVTLMILEPRPGIKLLKKNSQRDANLIVRYLINDHPQHYKLARDFFDLVKIGRLILSKQFLLRLFLCYRRSMKYLKITLRKL